MEKIESFKVNHNVLQKGMYISRVDGDIVTYDIRMKKPNNDENDYLKNAEMHTFEHLFATFVRNTKYAEDIIYVGPMGCRTGFYFIVRNNINHSQALKLVQDAFMFISNYEGEIPGVSKIECGNYKEHDLKGARNVADDMLDVLENWSEEKMVYEQ